jgi:arylsulfatase A-like enzyme
MPMKREGNIKSYRCRALCVAVTAMAVLALALPTGTLPAAPAQAAPAAFAPATFDLFSMFPQQVLSPATGRTITWLPVETRNISGAGDWTWLSVRSESPYFNALVIPPLVRPSGPQGKAKSWVLVSCSTATPEGTVGYFKVTGIRGAEQHRVWLKVTSIASRPVLENSAGDLLTGQGYRKPLLQAYTGAPLTWHLAATNQGGGTDTFPLGYHADFPCVVRFKNTAGAEINQVTVSGLSQNYLYPTPVYLNAEVVPTEPLPKNRPANVTFELGPGLRSSTTSRVTVQVLNPGMLFCVNDLDGLRPHAHQVMPGETTSFIFHVTNFESSPADISLEALAPEGGWGEWAVNLEPREMRGVAPGETRQATLTAVAPSDATVGERMEAVVSAASASGKEERVSVAAEVTDVRNVYYFSIDSMNPEYLDLDRAGTGPGSEGDWLMPNIRSFLEEGVRYLDARVYLPSATDMNHTNALAGTYTGTMGIYMVGGTFAGFTEHDEVITRPNSMELMRYGPQGDPIKRIFEVAKEVTGGKALTGFWSNKNWLADIEGERSVDIVGSSERFPLFFPPPYKYRAAGDPRTDTNPWDPLSAPFSACFYGDTTREVIVPALLGQFNLILGLGLYIMPINVVIGFMPGNHCEDRYLVDSFLRSIAEEDPDVCYINAADLDNTGHFTGGSWTRDEWDTRGTASAADDVSRYSPWMRRDECLDICREVDALFAEFIRTLKERGVYDNSVIVLLSDHGMENVKDSRNGYEVLDLRQILRAHGLLLNEDYHEGGGTEINQIWCDDPAKLQAIEDILEGYTVNDPELGPVQPLIVINRQEAMTGVDFGELGHVRPMELYSEYWAEYRAAHPDESGGHLWPDLFVFPRYNYNVAAHGQVLAGAINPVGITLGNVPDNVLVGFPAAHGGLQTTHMTLAFKAPEGWPGYRPGGVVDDEVEVGDIAPTIYEILGWPAPDCVDGKPLPKPPPE